MAKLDNKKNINFLSKFKNIKEKKLLVITIIGILVLIGLLATTTYAMFFSNDSSSDKDLFETGGLVVTLNDETSTSINLTPAKPVSDAYGSTLEPYTFSIENTGSYYASYNIYLNDITSGSKIPTNLIKFKLNELVPEYLSNVTNSAGEIVLSSGIIAPGSTLTYDLRLWIAEEATTAIENSGFTGQIAISGKAVKNHEQPQPNEPVLAEGMIPVVYDESNDVWEVADTNSKWYDYSKQKWANAVTTSVASYRTASAGTPIPMSDINSMWVWIPRFKYNIPSSIGSSSAVTSPPQINVIFESGTEATGVSETVYRNALNAGSANSNYYTHPAFRNIDNIEYDSSTLSRGAWDKEIKGFWVGKFETGTTTTACNTSASEENCKNVIPIIKPDVQSLRYQNASTQFITALKFAGGTFDSSTGKVTFTANSNNAYGLNTTSNTTDTHMMKNTEWGAVAILSQSQYGKMGNANYTGIDKEIYINNSGNSTTYISYTGRSGGTPNQSVTTYGTYSYNDMTCGTASTECTGTKVAYKGTGASTTGTIYGVYDMSGGNGESTMGNWASTASYSGFTTLPSSKYCDLYKGTSSESIEKAKAILGDTTFETMNWYSDYSYFVNDDTPWVSRGGHYIDSSVAGVFTFDCGYGEASDFGNSFRTLLIP